MSGSRMTDQAIKKQEPKNIRNKKNTKKWCKGKVGKEHEYVIGRHQEAKDRDQCHYAFNAFWYCYHVEICKNCNKQNALPEEKCPTYTKNRTKKQA